MPVCLEALSLLVDVLLEPGGGQDIDRARALCVQLATADAIRERFWTWRAARCSAVAAAAAKVEPPIAEVS